MNEWLLIMAVLTSGLDDNRFIVRQRSQQGLEMCGVLAGAHLEAAQKSPSPEVRHRADGLMAIARGSEFYNRFCWACWDEIPIKDRPLKFWHMREMTHPAMIPHMPPISVNGMSYIWTRDNDGRSKCEAVPNHCLQWRVNRFGQIVPFTTVKGCVDD